MIKLNRKVRCDRKFYMKLLAFHIIFLVIAGFILVMMHFTPVLGREIADPVNSVKIDKIHEDVGNIFEKIKTSDVKLSFFGTEYSPGEDGTIWLQLLRNHQPINNATCHVVVYNPDKSMLLDNMLMNYLAGSDGIYYYSLTVPAQTGVYMMSAACCIPQSAWSDDFIDYSKIESYENVTIVDDKIVLSQISLMTASDNSGNDRDGDLMNMEVSDWTDGKLNEALNFDGVDEYVTMSDIGNFDRFDPFSLECWLKTSDGLGWIISKQMASWPYRGYSLDLHDDGHLFFTLVSTYSSRWMWIKTDSTYNDGAWHHLAATYDGSSSANGLKIYVDGNLATSSIGADTLSGSIANDADFTLASRNGIQLFLNGYIDEAVVYDKKLSQAEISSRYNSGAGTENMPIGLVPYGWWHLNYIGENKTKGYVRSTPIALSNDVDTWSNFFADHVLNDGSVIFKVLNASNAVLCADLGNIYSCAGDTSPVKLYAELSRPTNISISPAVDRWLVYEGTVTLEEIRGSGEMHVSDSIKKAYIYAEMLEERLIHNHDYCVDNVTLRKELLTEKCYFDDCFNITKNLDTVCTYGCYEDACAPSPRRVNMYVLAAILAFCAILYFIYDRIR